MTKTCTECKQEKELNSFYKAKRNKDGLLNKCKDCCKKNNERRLANYNRQVIDYKKCNKCGVVKDSSEFSKGRNNKDELHGCCRKCDKESHSKWFQDNFDEEKARQLKWRSRYPERFKQAAINWRNSPEGKLSQRQSKKRRNTIKKHVESTFTEEQWQECLKYFDYKCAYCETSDNLQHDHFIPVDKHGSYTKDNIVCACSKCNASKGHRDFFKWYPKQEFYNEKRENKILEYLGYNKQNLAV